MIKDPDDHWGDPSAEFPDNSPTQVVLPASKPKGTPSPSPKTTQAVQGMAADIPVQIVCVLGRRPVSVGDLLKLAEGEVVELDRFPHDAVDLVVNGKLMAKGELVEIDGKLGVRIVKMLTGS